MHVVTIDTTGAHEIRRRIAQRPQALELLKAVVWFVGVALHIAPGFLTKGILQASLLLPPGKWIGTIETRLRSRAMGADTLA